MSSKQIITALVLALTLGLHWAALQSAAWVSMIIRYSRNATLQEAIEQTFDGRHPCAVCHFIADCQKSEENDRREQPPPRTPLKLDLLCESPRAFIFQMSPFAPVEPGDQTWLVRFERPAFPPPRHV